MILVGFIGVSILVAGFKLDPFGFAVGLVGSIGLAGLALSLATMRKTEFARFVNEARVVVLDIARSGKDRNRFQEFTGLVVTQIRKAQGAT